MGKIKLKYHYAMALKDILPIDIAFASHMRWYRGDCILTKMGTDLCIRASYKSTERTKPCMPIEKAVIKIRRAFGIKLKLSKVITQSVTLALENKQ